MQFRTVTSEHRNALRYNTCQLGKWFVAICDNTPSLFLSFGMSGTGSVFVLGIRTAFSAHA